MVPLVPAQRPCHPFVIPPNATSRWFSHRMLEAPAGLAACGVQGEKCRSGKTRTRFQPHTKLRVAHRWGLPAAWQCHSRIAPARPGIVLICQAVNASCDVCGAPARGNHQVAEGVYIGAGLLPLRFRLAVPVRVVREHRDARPRELAEHCATRPGSPVRAARSVPRLVAATDCP